MALSVTDKRHPIRVACEDFPRVSRYDNFLLTFLKSRYEVTEDKENPDIILSSCWGIRHLLYERGIQIFTTIENVAPNFNACDYAITPMPLDFGDRHLWLPPCFALRLGKGTPQLEPPKEEDFQRRFCSFVYSSDKRGRGSYLRKQFCQKLMQEYAPVDCPSQILHNMDAPELSGRWDEDDWQESKIRFLSRYKFTIAFENSSSPGYITEKLLDAFMANTVPIYWGGGGDISPFPKEAMIDAADYPDWDSLIQRIKEVNENRDLYLSLLAANPLRHGMQIDKSDELAHFIENILNRPAARKDNDKQFGWGDAVIFRSFMRAHWLLKMTLPLGLISFLAVRALKPLSWGRVRRTLARLQKEIGDYLFIAKHL